VPSPPAILLLLPPGSPPDAGNRVTAERWARLLREAGAEVEIAETWDGRPPDLAVALHARKSAPELERLRAACPGTPVVVALTGTDLYGDLPGGDGAALRSLQAADRIVALHPGAEGFLPEELRDRVRVVLQSAEAPEPRPLPDPERFPVCVLSHLRPVKDPLRPAEAARYLPPESRIEILHAGAPLDPELAERARAETRDNPRYHWLGPLPRGQALRLLGASRALVLPSLSEGGANVLSEAAVRRVPILASRIPSSLALLGEDHPGWFESGDTLGLAALLRRLEEDPFLEDALQRSSEGLARRVRPAAERRAWEGLLGELLPDRRP